MKNKKMKQFQQGDVNIQQIAKPTEQELSQAVKINPCPRRGYVFAEGETTSHEHSVKEIDDMELIKIGERMLAKIEKEVTIKHQEHLPITLKPGWYDIGIVVEEDEEFGDMVNVRD